MRRRVVLQETDVLVVRGLELDAAILMEMMDARPRLLWAFVREGGDIRPVAYDESRVIWLTDEDLDRRDELPAAV